MRPVGSKREEWSGFQAKSEHWAQSMSSTTVHRLRNSSTSGFIQQCLVTEHAQDRAKRDVHPEHEHFPSLTTPKHPLSLGCLEWHPFVTDARQALQNRYRIVTVWTSFPHTPEAYCFQNRPPAACSESHHPPCRLAACNRFHRCDG